MEKKWKKQRLMTYVLTYNVEAFLEVSHRQNSSIRMN